MRRSSAQESVSRIVRTLYRLPTCVLLSSSAPGGGPQRGVRQVFLSWDPKPAPRRELAVPRGALALVLVGTGVVLVVAIADPAGSSWLTLAVLVLPPCVRDFWCV